MGSSSTACIQWQTAQKTPEVVMIVEMVYSNFFQVHFDDRGIESRQEKILPLRGSSVPPVDTVKIRKSTSRPNRVCKILEHYMLSLHASINRERNCVYGDTHREYMSTAGETSNFLYPDRARDNVIEQAYTVFNL